SADDVKFTLDKVMDPAVNSPLRSTFTHVVESVTLVDSKTIKIKTSKPYAPLLNLLGSFFGLRIVPKHILEKEANLAQSSFNKNPIGTGPFKFVSWEGTDIIRLKRFD